MKLTEAQDSMKNVVRRKHYSLSTEKTYLGWLKQWCDWLRLHPGGSREARFEDWLSAMARRGVAASTQNQAFNAIRFFYLEVLKQPLRDVNALRAKRPVMVRYSPSPTETRRLLAAVQDHGGHPIRLIVLLLYGCGLRVMEPLNLRLKDVDLEKGALFIRGAKGGKDRVVKIPPLLRGALERQMKIACRAHELDKARGVPVPLPNLLERKYPNHGFSRGWYWLFPANGTCVHPRSGAVVRWRCHEANVQRAVRSAAGAAGLDGLVTPHCLRHAYATHLLDAGENVRGVQLAMGHSQLETTMGYVHADALAVGSPLTEVMGLAMDRCRSASAA